MVKSTKHLEPMVKRVLAHGIRADYLLMDSWFAFPSILAPLGKHLPVICVGKDMPKVFVLPLPGAMVDLGSLVQQIEETPR